MGGFRRAGRCLNSAVSSCPVATMNKIAAAGRLKVGWTRARATLRVPTLSGATGAWGWNTWGERA